MKPNVPKIVVMALVVIVLGLGVLYVVNKPSEPQKSVQPTQDWYKFAYQAKTEAECEQIPRGGDARGYCYHFVAKITKDISLCEKAGSSRESCRSNLNDQLAQYSESEAKAIIANRTREVIVAMKNYDLSKLSIYVHPQKGVRFSPYSYIDTKIDLVFSADKIQKAAGNITKYVWGGYDGSGAPIELTLKEYFKKFVYSYDFAIVKDVSYNRTIASGNTLNNVFEIYPQAIVVEYYFPGSDPKYVGMDWESLRLVFEEFNDSWYLRGVVHDEWTI